MRTFHFILSYFSFILLAVALINAVVSVIRKRRFTDLDKYVYSAALWFFLAEGLLGIMLFINRQLYNVYIQPVYAFNPILNFYAKTHTILNGIAFISAIWCLLHIRKNITHPRIHIRVLIFLAGIILAAACAFPPADYIF